MAGETVVVEPLNGGLVTARDPSLLRRGEVQQCQDTFYKPNDQAIWRAPGRIAYNDNAQGGPDDIKGMRFLLFDDADNVLMIHHDTSYAYSTFDDENESANPAFAEAFDEVGSGPTLDSVHYNNKHTLLNGVAATDGSEEQGNNHVFKSDQVMRRQGLDPVVSTPDVALGTGSWPNDETLPINKWYFFIYTEVHAALTTDELESTWGSVDPTGEVTSVPAAIYVNSASVGVDVTRQPIINSGEESDGTALIDHWRVYMSTPQEGTSGVRPPDPPLSAYALVTPGAGVTVVNPTSTQTVTISNQSAAVGFEIAGDGANIDAGLTDWGSPTSITADDNSGASVSIASPGGGSDWLAGQDFGLAAITGTITGIEVEVKLRRITSAGSSNSNTRLFVNLSNDDGATQNGSAAYEVIDNLPLNEWVVRRVGGAANLWGGTWVAGDFADGSFATRMQMSTVVGGIEVDYVKAKVYAGGQGLAYGVPFPSVTVEVGGVSFTVGANGPPPVASTGDVFESQMVLNDVQDQSRIVYSMPDHPEYYPWVYFLNFETKEQDIVTCIRRLGNKLVVGHRNSIFRVNYLPRETDAEFDRGRCYESITERHGIVGTQASALFTPPEKPMMLAYVSAEGIHATDGFQTTTLTEDLDWPNTVSVSDLDSCILVDYPPYSSLVLYYTPPGGSANTRALWLNYHPSHVKEGGKLLVTGPNIAGSGSSGTSSAHLGRLNNGWSLMTGRPDGIVYVEDRGVDDEAGIGINPIIVTRDIYPVGIGYEATVERLWVRKYQATSPTMTVTVTPYKRNTDSALAQVTTWVKTFTTALLGLSRLEMHFPGESYQFKFTSPDAEGGDGNNEIGISYLAMEIAAHGLEEAKQTSS